MLLVQCYTVSNFWAGNLIVIGMISYLYEEEKSINGKFCHFVYIPWGSEFFINYIYLHFL